MFSDRWAQYTEALVEALGCATPLVADATWACQLLLLPTFHQSSCLAVSGTATAGALGFTLLDDSVDDLFDAIWRRRADRLDHPELWRPRNCIADLALLSAAECATLDQQLAALDPWVLDDVNLAARDGIALRARCTRDGQQHTVFMTSPSRAHAPQHTALVAWMLGLGKAHFPAEQVQQYLAIIERYLQDEERQQ